MKGHWNSLTFVYVLLCFLGVVVICVGVLADFTVYINPLLIIIGGVMSFAGTISFIDKYISGCTVKRAARKWKIYYEVSDFLKWALLEILIIGLAFCYLAIGFLLIRSVSLPR